MGTRSHVTRLARDQPIYVPPSLDFIPLAYMPLYPALVSVAARFGGPALWHGRLLSWLCAVATAALIAWIVAARDS